MIEIDDSRVQRLHERLQFLYGETTTAAIWPDFCALLAKHQPLLAEKQFKAGWDAQDVVLITYGDSIRRSQAATALPTLKQFADKWLQDAFSVIHLLPIFPYTSDDGFSVSDFRSVRSQLGQWDDVSALGEHFDLMFDFVLNHCSRVSLYFSDFRANREPYIDFFIFEDPDKDWSKVVRPRSTPLLTEIPTHQGMRYVWTTFSADQVDLNYRNPRVLLEMLDILLFYLNQGSRITRLDAIAFLWKAAGTSCLHLPQTHEVVKIMRDVTDLLCPGALLLTETNVPHQENISYFGQGDEAQMVYQFSLPPLLLHAIHTGNTHYLYSWLHELTPPPPGCTYFNFTASHDGIGVRPLEGLLPAEELRQLLDDMRAKGAYVSTRRHVDGRNVPYEINITYFDAFRNSGNRSAPWQVSRFLLSQTVALSLRGIPGIYIHSLLATPNDYERVEVTGATRSINRHQWDADELDDLLKVPESSTSLLLREYLRRIRIRRQQPAFHPDALQEVFDAGKQLLMFLRIAPDRQQKIMALYNFSKTPLRMDTERLEVFLGNREQWWDLLYDARPECDGRQLVLKPYACHWLTLR